MTDGYQRRSDEILHELVGEFRAKRLSDEKFQEALMTQLGEHDKRIRTLENTSVIYKDRSHFVDYGIVAGFTAIADWFVRRIFHMS